MKFSLALVGAASVVATSPTSGFTHFVNNTNVATGAVIPRSVLASTHLQSFYNPGNESPTNYTHHIPSPGDQVKCDTAEECWGDHKAIGPDTWWEKTPENVDASGAIVDFYDWINEYNSTDIWGCKDKKYSPMKCYVATFLANSDFQCRLDQLGQCHIPTPYETMSVLAAQFPDLPAKNVTDLGRSVYLTLKNFEAISANAWTLYGLMNEVKDVFDAKAGALVNTFTPQPDAFQTALCQFTKNTINMIIQIAGSIWGQQWASGAITSALVRGWDGDHVTLPGWVKLLYPGWYEVTNDPPPERPAGSSLATYIITHIFMLFNEGQQAYNYATNSAAAFAGRNSEWPWLNPGGMAALALTQTKADDVCGNFFGVGKDDSKANMEALKNYVIALTEGIQSSMIYNHEDMLSSGDGYGLAKLKALMGLDYSETTYEQSQKSFQTVRMQTRSALLNRVASELLTKSRCYVDCQERYDLVDKCNATYRAAHENPVTSLSRGCFPGLELGDARCQMQCLSKFGINNAKVPVYGVDRMERDFGIKPQTLLNNSVALYVDARMNNHDPFRPISVMDKDRAALKPANATLQLPVCWGGEIATKSHRINRLSHKWMKSPQQMPLYCGSSGFGEDSETGAFMTRIGLDLKKEKEYREKMVAQQIDRLGAWDQFQVLCGANVRFPTLDGKAFKIQRKATKHQPEGKSLFCNLMAIETISMTKSQKKYHFCHSKNTTKKLFPNEYPWEDSQPFRFVKNHAGKCRNYKNGPMKKCTDCNKQVIEKKRLAAWDIVYKMSVPLPNATAPANATLAPRGANLTDMGMEPMGLSGALNINPTEFWAMDNLFEGFDEERKAAIDTQMSPEALADTMEMMKESDLTDEERDELIEYLKSWAEEGRAWPENEMEDEMEEPMEEEFED